MSGRRGRGRIAALALLAAASWLAGGCTDFEDALASVDFLNFMREAPWFDPYEAPRPPPPNAVPFASPAGVWEPPLTPDEATLVAFGDTATNPLPMTPEVLAAGRAAYDTYCTVCHGVGGKGDGPIIGGGKFPFAPNLTLPLTVQRTDGYIYGVIRVGRGLMPSYERIPRAQRWAIVNYVRQLHGRAPRPEPAADTAAAGGAAEGGARQAAPSDTTR